MKKVLVLLLSISLVACSGGDHQSEGDATPVDAPKEAVLYNEIVGLDSALIVSATMEEMVSLGEEQLQKCEQYFKAYPKGLNRAEIMLKAANASRALNQSDKAVTYLKNFTQSFSNHPDRPEALFTLAFILDEDLQDKDQAKRVYTEIITKYPKSPYKSQAEILMEQLYLSDAELIEQLRLKNQ